MKDLVCPLLGLLAELEDGRSFGPLEMKLSVSCGNDFSEANGIFNLKSPRKMTSLVSSSAFPLAVLPPERTLQISSRPIPAPD